MNNNTLTIVFGATLIVAATFTGAFAKDFQFLNVTDLPGSPGHGNSPSVNNQGDLAFYADDLVYFFDRSTQTFLNINGLAQAPPTGRYPKMNNAGDIVFIEPTSRDLWLYESESGNMTNISAQSGYPGNSQANSTQIVFDLNDNQLVSFHSGGLNSGDIYLYDHTTQTFLKVTDKVGGSSRGRENLINNSNQVAYQGFPDLYVYDLASDTTTNVSDLPGGPGTAVGSDFRINDLGDVVFIFIAQTIYFHADTASFETLSALPGFPSGSFISYSNDLSNHGEVTFCMGSNYYYDPFDQTFTTLNGHDGIPTTGRETSISSVGIIAFTAGLALAEDIYLAIPQPHGDLNGNGILDLADLEVFTSCLEGPATPVEGACNAFDEEPDHDLDLYDFSVFQQSFGM